jgi:dTDP-4-dehydrorhamnose reductase
VKRALVIGGDGTMGKALCRHLTHLGINVDSTSRREGAPLYLDMGKDVPGWIPPGKYDACFLFAAIAGMDECENHPNETHKINVERTVELAEKLAGTGCRLVFPSTSQVFDGSVPSPETDAPTCPSGEYGRQKAEAEIRLAALNKDIVIIRYAKVLPSLFPLLADWRKALENNEGITPFSDLNFAPVPLEFALEATTRIAAEGTAGIWHVSGTEDISYAQAAQWIAEDVGAPGALVTPVTTAESGKEVSPVKHSALGVNRLIRELDLIPPAGKETILNASKAHKG